MKDQILTCANCGQQFPFTQGEQQFYAQKGLEQPTLCMICRSIQQQAVKDKYRGHSSFQNNKLKS